MSCYKFDWRNENTVKLGTRVRWRNNLVKRHHTNDILKLDVKIISEFWKSGLLEVDVQRFQLELDVSQVEGGGGFFMSLFIDLYRFSLSLSLSLSHSLSLLPLNVVSRMNCISG